MRRVAIVIVLACLAGCGDGPGSTSDQGRPPRAAVGGPSVLVVYHSVTKNTATMAEAVAEGVRRAPGVAVVVRAAADVTREDLDAAEGLVLGGPTWYGNLPGAMKVHLDTWAWKWRVDLTDKVGGAFATGGNTTGGKEHVIQSLLLYMMHNRMIVVGPTYETPTMQYGQMGASAVTGSHDPGVDDDELGDARVLGERVARVMQRLWRDPVAAPRGGG